MLIKLPSGYIQQSPWLGISHKQLDLMAKFMSELGLTPVSRGRVAAKPIQLQPWEFTAMQADCGPTYRPPVQTAMFLKEA